jgi:hypothetical protein
LKFALCLISVDEAPILTMYFPASAIHEVRFVLKDARSGGLIINFIVTLSPAFNNPVFAKPLSSSEGLFIELFKR